MGWKDAAGSDDQEYTDEDVEELIDSSSSTYTSPICCCLYGEDGSGKTGVALDHDVEGKIFVLDWDQSAAPIAQKFHKDKDIQLLTPTTMDNTGRRNYHEEINKTYAAIKYVIEHDDEYDVLVIDGLSRLLKTLEYRMKEDANIGEEERVQNLFEWSKRNQPFMRILLQAQSFNGRTIFTTHMKKIQEMTEQGPMVIDKEPIWTKGAPQIFYQRIHMKRKPKKDGSVKINGVVDKAKANPNLENNTYDVFSKGDGSYEWNGLGDFWNEIEGG